MFRSCKSSIPHMKMIVKQAFIFVEYDENGHYICNLPNGLLREAYSRDGERSTVGSSVILRFEARPPGLLAPELAAGTEL